MFLPVVRDKTLLCDCIGRDSRLHCGASDPFLSLREAATLCSYSRSVRPWVGAAPQCYLAGTWDSPALEQLRAPDWGLLLSPAVL